MPRATDSKLPNKHQSNFCAGLTGLKHDCAASEDRHATGQAARNAAWQAAKNVAWQAAETVNRRHGGRFEANTRAGAVVC